MRGGGLLDIAHGGTGAVTAEQALTNLGAASKAEFDTLNKKVTDLLANGGTIAGVLTTKGGSNVWTVSANSGKTGYLQIAEFKFKVSYANSPILLTAQSRSQKAEHVEIAFSNANSTDPELSRFEYFGGNFLYLHKTDIVGTWRLYARKSEAYDSICITDFQLSGYMQSHVAWTWTDIYASSLPSGYKSATPYSI